MTNHDLYKPYLKKKKEKHNTQKEKKKMIVALLTNTRISFHMLTYPSLGKLCTVSDHRPGE